MTIATPMPGLRSAGNRRSMLVDVGRLLELPEACGVQPVAATIVPRGPIPAVPERPCLIVEGAVFERVQLGRRSAALLLGPGDVLAADGIVPPPYVARAVALTKATLAPAGRWSPDRPAALHVALLHAAHRREQLLAEQSVLAQLSRLEDRLELLLPKLADRWGVVSPSGVLLPAFLRHWVLADLTGARRPSLTSAMGRLAAAGTVVRTTDGRWRIAFDLGDRPAAAARAPEPWSSSS